MPHSSKPSELPNQKSFYTYTKLNALPVPPKEVRYFVAVGVPGCPLDIVQKAELIFLAVLCDHTQHTLFVNIGVQEVLISDTCVFLLRHVAHVLI